MSVHKYKTILERANQIKAEVLKNYAIKHNKAWSYFFAKSILQPKKDIKKIAIKQAKSDTTGDHFSRQVSKNQFTDMAKRFVNYVEKKGQLPNYITVSPNRKMNVNDYTFMFARLIVFYQKYGKLPNSINVNSKYFIKPTEPTNDVYDYFVKTFGSFGDTIDGALEKIAGHGYGYYYDDVYSNKQAIDRMANYQGVNCTDSCHVFYNILLALIKKGKYRKVECLHVLCSGGDGHVRLRITLNDGDYIYRDPAAVLSSGDITYNWCASNYTLLDVNPDWFLENINR